MVDNSDRKYCEPAAYRDYRWIVQDPSLGGRLAIRGTQLSVAFVLSCLAQGMRFDQIEETYGHLPQEAFPEVLKVALELDGSH